MADQKSIGVIFINTWKQGKQPDYTGHIELTPKDLKALIDNYNAGHTPRLQLASWVRKSKNGNEFLSVSGEVVPPEKDRFNQDRQQNQQSREFQKPAQSNESNNNDNFSMDDDIPFR